MKSPNTRNGFLGKRSIQGATNSGIKKLGINWIAITRADAKVLPVSSKTRNDNAKLPGADQKKLESVGSVLWDMCSILSFQN